MSRLRTVPTQHDCRSCQLAHACLCGTLDRETVAQVSDLAKGLPPMPRGAVLYSQGEERRSFFVLRSGLAKAVCTGSGGCEEVVAFYYPGDLIGTSSYGLQDYVDSVELLDRSSICELPAFEFEQACADYPALHRVIIERMTAEILVGRQARLRLTNTTAEHRVADFLLEISCRMAALRRNSDELQLIMSRREIGSYLGLAAETVSRILRQFAKAGVIDIRGRQTTILDRSRLRLRAGRNTDGTDVAAGWRFHAAAVHDSILAAGC